MVKDIIYSCSKCGCLPNPSIYGFHKKVTIENRWAYLIEDGKLKIPIEKRTIFRCCDIVRLVPYHGSSKEYIESIGDILLFHIKESWVEEILSPTK